MQKVFQCQLRSEANRHWGNTFTWQTQVLYTGLYGVAGFFLRLGRLPLLAWAPFSFGLGAFHFLFGYLLFGYLVKCCVLASTVLCSGLHLPELDALPHHPIRSSASIVFITDECYKQTFVVTLSHLSCVHNVVKEYTQYLLTIQ